MKKDEPAVIILNYNSSGETALLCESLDKYDPGLCVIVVDNCSDGPEREKLKALEKSCILLYLDKNLGYSAGNNAGIRKACELGYETCLLANSDTRLIRAHSVRACYAFMKAQGAGILGPKLVNEAGRDVSGMIRVDRYGRTKHEYTDKTGECMSLTGAFLFIDRSVIEKIGYLREFYFLYREDTDYCVRAYNEGIKLIYYPEVLVVHKEGTTTKKEALYYYYRNMFIFSREIYGTGSIRLALFYFFRFVKYSCHILKRKGTAGDKAAGLKLLWRAYGDGVRDKRGRTEDRL